MISATTGEPGGRSTHPLWLVLLLAVFALAVFWPATGFDFVNMDDDLYVTANPQVLGGLRWETVPWAFGGLKAGFWHPLTWLSFMLDVTLWGPGAAGFHLTNLLLHAANSALVFLLWRRLTRANWRSAVVAALFAVHPLRVEAVVWVSERKELLGAFFGLLTLLMYARYVEESRARSPKANGWYGLAVLFFTCALMGKPMEVTLPVIMLLLDWWPLRRMGDFSLHDFRRWGPPLIREKLPFVALGMACGCLTLTANSHIWQTGSAPALQFSLPERLANATLSYALYLGEMIWPFNLAALYPYSTAIPVWKIIAAALVLVVLTAFAVRLRRPYLLMGWLWYGVTLLPVIGLIQVGAHAHADRYVYLPLIGVFTALAWGADELRRRWRMADFVAAGLVLAVLSAWMVRARDQLKYWRNSGSLFAHTAAVTENNFFAYTLLGHYQAGHGQTDEAMKNFQRAVQINPNYADAWNNLGLALAGKGQLPAAIANYRRALVINPMHAAALNNLGIALTHEGQAAEAMDCYRRALAINPAQAETAENLAGALAARGKFTEAIPYYETAVRARPDQPEFLVNLAAALGNAGRREEAVARYRQALRLNPNLTEVREFLRAAGVPF